MTRAVMTIHGFLTDVDDFCDLYDSLTMYDCVEKCKIPGHNDNVNFKLFNVEDTVKTVLDCYDKLQSKYDKVDVVGFSMGGALTTYLCCTRPVNRAVLLAPANKYINSSSLLKSLSFYYKEYSKALMGSQGKLRERLKQAEQWMAPYVQNTRKSVSIGLQRLLPNINIHTFSVFRELMKECNQQLEQLQDKVSVPTLLVWGELDELVPRKSQEYICQYFDNIKCNIHNDVGHALLFGSKASVLIDEIVTFLQQEQG